MIICNSIQVNEKQKSLCKHWFAEFKILYNIVSVCGLKILNNFVSFIIGQHLLSAVLETKFGYSTLAWWLGENVAYIELDTKQVTEDQKNEVEAILNKYIRENLPVKVLVYEKDDPRINVR